MNLQFEGVPKRFKKKQLKRAIEYFADSLLTQRQLNKLQLYVGFVPYRSDDFEGAEVEQISQFEYQIYVDKKTEHVAEVLEYVAHEMVHVQQFVSRVLVDIDCNTSKWKLKKYKLDKLDYFDYPWEIDAYGRGYCLYRKYIKEVM